LIAVFSHSLNHWATVILDGSTYDQVNLRMAVQEVPRD
jgi:hypothetical protein